MICLGLDLDPRKMPTEFGGTLKGMFEYAKKIIEATSDQVCAYKPNLAFYESHGPEGLSLLKLIRDRIPENVPVILDGKRNDIGNTAMQYAHALFDVFRADWITVNPYMGHDSMRPFIERRDKGVFVLCLTSNPGSKDFQQLPVEGRPLYEHVVQKVSYWNKDNNCGLVVGATHPEQLKQIRDLAGDMPILIPGVGAQGGSLEEAILAGSDHFRKPALINVSRAVLYASEGPDFAQRARQELMQMNAVVTKLRAGERAQDKGPQAESPQPTSESVDGSNPPAPEPSEPNTPPADSQGTPPTNGDSPTQP